MRSILTGLTYATTGAFAALAVASIRDWHRERSLGRRWQVVAVDSLALVAILSVVAAPHVPAAWLGPFAIAIIGLFLFSGYGVLMMRSSFIPLSGPAHRTAASGLAGAGLATVAVLLLGPSRTPSLVDKGVAALIVMIWGGCLAEPVFRFWQASRRRPAVQRARLRALSIGLAGLVGIVIVDGLTPSLSSEPSIAIAIQVVALAIVPLLYASFSPPAWLRRLWRQTEEEQLNGAVRDLILFSPDRRTLGERALDWALRLVGGAAGLVEDCDGSFLARRGLDEDEARALVSALGSDLAPGIRQLSQGRTAIVNDLPLVDGQGWLIIVAGPFTPVFGSDEWDRLSQYAINVSAGLDRARVTERLTALERTKSEFLNLASHELRGPITLLRGYISMAEQGALGPLGERLEAVLPIMSAQADEMSGMVDQMLEAARLEEGKLQLHPRRIDLRDVAKKAVDQVRVLAEPSHELVLDNPSREVPAVVDPERIATILTNLLSNAIKYSPGGGEVRCVVARDKNLATVRVTDHGIGIADVDMQRLFTRFGRIVNNETSHIGGTGLGLYLSRELARLHGGDITAESSIGSGSTFQLAVPLVSSNGSNSSP